MVMQIATVKLFTPEGHERTVNEGDVSRLLAAGWTKQKPTAEKKDGDPVEKDEKPTEQPDKAAKKTEAEHPDPINEAAPTSRDKGKK